MNYCEILKNSYYINLINRTKRKDHIELELKKINVNNPTRIDAIKHNLGIIGCLKSHIKTIETFLSDNKDEQFVAIFEDDVVFNQPETTISCIDKIAKDDDWDVCLIGGMNDGEYSKYKNLPAVKVTRCMSCAAYIVKRSYIPTLLGFWKNFLKDAEELVKTANGLLRLDLISLDMAWFSLQRKDTFILLTPLCVTQLEVYSDNWRQVMNWDEKMLNL